MKPSFFKNSSAVLLAVTGKDATDYLNARLTNTIGSDSVLAACLNPQGRVLGLFQVVQLGVNDYLLAADAGDPATLKAELARYIVADQVQVKDVTMGWQVLHLTNFNNYSDLAIDFSGQHKVGAVWINSGVVAVITRRSENPGLDLIIPSDLESDFDQKLMRLGLFEEDANQAEARRIRAGILKFPDEINEGVLLPEAGLDGVVSFRKGCYVGQETIERVSALGKPPRVIKWFKIGSGVEFACGAEVFLADSGVAVGKVLNVVMLGSGGERCGFMIIKNSLSPDSKIVLAQTEIRVSDLRDPRYSL